MKKKDSGIIILVVILSILVFCLGGFIVYDKFLATNDMEDKNDGNSNENKINDSNDLEQLFNNLAKETSDNRDFYFNSCADKLQGKFCTIISLADGWGIYFISDDSLYFGDLAKKKLHKIQGFDGTPIKVISGTYSSDETKPVIGVLTNKGMGYITSADIESDENIISRLTSFTKITSSDKISDLVILQNYEVYRGENAPQGGYAMMFAKIGYQWKIVNISNDAEKAELGKWLRDIEISQS